jgi:hypothetical protein
MTELLIRNADGPLEGRDPRELPLEALDELPGPLAAIRAKCIDCSAGNMAEVRWCVVVKCPLWPYRMGTNPRRAGQGPREPVFLKKPSSPADFEADPCRAGQGTGSTAFVQKPELTG